MTKGLLSIVIPVRSDQYLQKTIDDLLIRARGPVEIIIVLDGIWCKNYNWSDPRIKVIHHGTIHNSGGMRKSINLGINIANGEYVMKTDGHCLFEEGYDEVLKKDCDNDWVVVPRRKRLDAENWKIAEDRRPDIDYMYIEYPYLKPLDKTQGLHGAEWKRPERKDILIDDNPTMQGSCYFMKKTYWDTLLPKGLDDENYGPFTQEAQEISMATWLSGGRFVVNKNTWYAHMHKGSKGKGYGFSNEQYKKHCEWNERGRLYCINKWLFTKQYKHDFKWFINEKFPGMPGWKETWERDIIEDSKKDYSTLGYKDDFWLSNLKK